MFIAGWSSQVARWAHNPKVTGSNPVPATILIADLGLRIADLFSIRDPKSKIRNGYGDVAQLGEHLICIQGVAGSIPVISTSFSGTSLSSRNG